jgi:hypothetical protein
MRRQFLALLILIFAISLFACANADGNDGDPADELDQGVTTTTAVQTTTTAAPQMLTVKFVDAEIFGGNVINESKIKYGKAARSPSDPSHEGYIFVGWDVKDFSSITSDMTITACYRPLDKYNVTFYGIDGKAISETVTYTEGDAITPPSPPLVYGKIFLRWDENLERVDRRWTQFSKDYATLSDAELAAAPIEYKVNAVYFDAYAIIPYKENISMEFKESKNQYGVTVYEAADDVFATTPAKFVSDDLKVYTLKGAVVEDAVYCKANISLAWDGEYIYANCAVLDPSILTRGEEVVFGQVNPFQNDSLELHYAFNVYPSKMTRKIAKVDAYGYRLFAGNTESATAAPEQSVLFNEIEYTHKLSKDANMYYIIFKIPAKTEAGALMQAGDYAAFSNQINDLRSLEDIKNFLCSGGLYDFDNLWKFMVLGKK